MGWWSRMRQGVTKQEEQTLTEIAQTSLDTLDRVSAQEVLERRENARLEAIQEADAAVIEAQTWLDAHPNTHSARRGDVRRLMRAVENLVVTNS